MTYRERRLARADKLREWSGKRLQRASADYAQARTMADGIPFGQPILVGHHSEKRDRNYRGRIHGKFASAFANQKKGESMAGRAESIEAQAERAIYDDDPDAIERLEKRIAQLEAERERYKAFNKTHVLVLRPGENRWNNAGTVGEVIGKGKGTVTVRRKDGSEETLPKAQTAVALPSYVLQNLGGNITRNRKRVEHLKRQQAHDDKRETREVGGATIGPAQWPGYVEVAFPVKPDRETLDDLRAAGFRWNGKRTCWVGQEANLPAVYA